MEKTKCVLIADTRERHVLRHSKEFETTSYEIKQITTGDYVILAPNQSILAVIERKSLEDYSASLKDGRHSNKQKLVDLRTAVGCRIVYIIEGPEFPNPNDCFGNIPYRYIESSIFHLMIRDGVTILRTKDSLDTAQVLARFVTSMDTLCQKVNTNDIINTSVASCVNIPLEKIIETPMNHTNVIERLTQKHDKTDHDVARELWSCFPGISVESADEYMKSWSLCDIVSDRVPENMIKNFKLSSGRNIGKKAINSLIDHNNKTVQIRLLSTIPGVSHSSALMILQMGNLRNLLSWGIGGLGMVVIGKNSRRLGNKLAEKIIKHFNYKYIPTATTNAIATTSIGEIEDPDICALINILI